MSEINDRIIGSEMEYGIMSTLHKRFEMSQVGRKDIQKYFHGTFENLGIAYVGRGEDTYLSNGARAYGDIGERREYATPEDMEPAGLLASEIAGEVITHTATAAYGANKGLSTSVSKRALDAEANGAGYHVSLSADAETVKITPDSLALYGVFAATRSILFGAGAMRSGGRYVIGQKSSILDVDFHTKTAPMKPVVNLREEQLCDRDKWVRVHDTSGDPNMAPWPTMNKVGAASIVLRLMESGRKMEQLRFERPLHEVAREVATDVDLKKRFKTMDGRSLSAIEVTREIITEAQMLAKEDGLSPVEQAALQEWDSALSDLAQDPKLVKSRVEWVSKLHLLRRYRERVGCDWESPLVRRVDYLFSDLSDKGLGLKLRQDEWAEYMPDQSMLDNRLTTPPSTTRAHLRGTAILDHMTNSCNATFGVSWSYVSHGGRTRHINNPFATTHSEIDDVCKMAA